MFRPTSLLQRQSWPALLALVVGIAAAVTTSPAAERAIAAQSSPAGTSAAGAEQPPVVPSSSADTSAAAETGSGGAQDALDEPQRITAGAAIWQQQCRHCHGRSAYPGKAPKLKPRKYTADFVYDRVTNGFRKMPPWKAVFSDDERWSIVAYVLSKKFSP